MSQKDLHNNVKLAVAFAPAVKNASVTGTGVDTAGYESAEIVFQVGAFTDGTHVIALMEADADTGYTAVVAADLIPAALPANITATGVRNFGYKGGKRWLRVDVTVTPGATGALYGAHIILSGARHNPAGATQVP